jgi:hypothetical protein
LNDASAFTFIGPPPPASDSAFSEAMRPSVVACTFARKNTVKPLGHSWALTLCKLLMPDSGRAFRLIPLLFT